MNVQPVLKASRIAFVEDDRDYREMLAYWLGLRYNLTCFDAPERFLEKLKAGARFDLIISDVNMPQISGPDLIAWVRANPSLRDTPAIALTAVSMEGPRMKALLSGFNVCLSKLVAFEELESRIDSLLNGRAACHTLQ